MVQVPGVERPPLLSRLEADARDEADRLLQAASAESERILGQARERLDRTVAAAVAHRTSDLGRERELRVVAATAEASGLSLAARNHLIDRVFQECRAQAAALMSTRQATEWLERTVPGVLGFLPEGPVRLMTSVPAAPGIAERVASGRRFTVVASPEVLGLVAESADGAVRVDATLDGFLRAERARLTLAIVRRVENSP